MNTSNNKLKGLVRRYINSARPRAEHTVNKRTFKETCEPTLHSSSSQQPTLQVVSSSKYASQNACAELTARLIVAAVGHVGYAIFLDKRPKALVCSQWASYQTGTCPCRFPEYSFYSHLQCHCTDNTAKPSLMSRKRNKKRIQNTLSVLVLSNAGLSVYISKAGERSWT